MIGVVVVTHGQLAVELLNAVEMINGLILSSKTGKPVTVPVDRAEYDRLTEELKAQSQAKSTVREPRGTDPAVAESRTSRIFRRREPAVKGF